MVRSLNAEMRATAISKADASLVYLQKELSATADMDTREAVNRSIENEIKQRMFAGVMEEYALRFVDQVMAPDSNKPVKPRKALPMVVGFMTGAVVRTVTVLPQQSFSSLARVST